ncbi:hypothetical protein GQ55_2G314400 [Panicum hallii var. hallii]|uniref:F-box domain-containing protein n=1 Tax=Panicum hallii var. hallii TaxID=1504633 RepID=A0A2T7EUF4_9POAL|nr:hypothetical protein GQ55_2G314400 [Panicum hallii var. hallii]
MAAAGAITPVGGGRDDAAPHLDDGVVSEFLHRLPTRDAYRLTAVCPRWRALISSPAFLSRHLSPRPLPLLEGLPDAIVLQPKKLGYTHLMLVATDPAVHVALNMPRLPKYTVWDRYRPPRTKLLPPSTPVMELGDHAAVFFERTVPMLDFTIEASHGRLLLGRGRTRYFVCDPAANRWLALPPPAAIPPTRDTACGFCYDVDAETGRVSFTVVLLARARFRRVLVETFSSATGSWATTMLDAQGVARCLGTASPGIHVGTCFYWLSRRRGRVLSYDAARGRATVVREPPDAEGSVERTARSLGSTGGRLRLCGFDIRDDNPSALPHYSLEGVHGVWVMDDAGAWRRVHEAVVENIQAWYFKRLLGIEKPLDFAGAPGGYIVLDKDSILLRYDLESGEKVDLVRFYRDDGCIGALYHRSHAFPFYRSG